MTRLITKFLAAGALAAAPIAMSITPAHADGAITFSCSDVFEGTGGTVVITPNGQLRANCHEHTQDGTGGSTGGGAQTIDCADASIPGPGVAVITPSGNTLTNCHIHQQL